jgi:hypothetical protein
MPHLRAAAQSLTPLQCAARCCSCPHSALHSSTYYTLLRCSIHLLCSTNYHSPGFCSRTAVTAAMATAVATTSSPWSAPHKAHGLAQAQTSGQWMMAPALLATLTTKSCECSSSCSALSLAAFLQALVWSCRMNWQIAASLEVRQSYKVLLSSSFDLFCCQVILQGLRADRSLAELLCCGDDSIRGQRAPSRAEVQRCKHTPQDRPRSSCV